MLIQSTLDTLDIQEFKTRSDLIVANRVAVQLEDVQSKVFSRDIFGEN